MTNTTAKTKAILNLTFDNLRKGDFSDKHAMIDVYLDGKFISTYQWNPFWKMDTKDLMKALKINKSLYAGWRNKEITDLLGYHNHSAEISLSLWQGKRWGKALCKKDDEKVTEIIFKYAEIKMPDAYDVESCLVSDATCAENCLDFDDFCWQMGYDTDSRKAHKIYSECKDILVRLIQTGKYEELKKLHEEN